MQRRLSLTVTLVSLSLFWLTVYFQPKMPRQIEETPTSVIIPAPAQVLLYIGDRYLAANIEEIRAVAAVTTKHTQAYRIRAHLVASRLNPCHEDNYWVGNASLSWEGADEPGFKLLFNAMHCRIWDEWPAFFYGFNQHFFRHDDAKARAALKLAAERSHDNAAAFTTFSIMLAAGELKSTKAAIQLLRDEKKNAKDPKLKDMLEKRIFRLEGLLILQNAQATYQKRYGKQLEDPQQLLSSKILNSYPQDPMNLGYDFNDNKFTLHKLEIRE